MAELTITNTFMAPGGGPVGLAWDGIHVWNADYTVGKIFQIDPQTGKETSALTCPGNLSGLTWTGDALWQSLHDQGWLRCINPQTNDFDRTIVIDDHGWLAGVAWDGTHLWTVSQQHGRILAVEVESGEVVRTIPAPIAGGGLDYAQGSLWLGIAYPMHFDEARQNFHWPTKEQNFAVLQLDPADGREIGRFHTNFLPMGLAWVNEELWLSHVSQQRLYSARLL